ncbi:MAG: MCE family protein [Labilithrix sp.]|nr:MCE family protein [Labilithrix sp.]MBX3223746.1 MCE family protein [Labilithrix sp.]
MSAKSRTLKVGVFVFIGLVLSTIAVFTIGENRRVWDRKVSYRAAYDDVVGLRPGSVVRMGGIDIGSVEVVEHGKEADDNKVYVTLTVAREEAGRIRNATVATIEGKGLLGDKMVQLAWHAKTADEQKKAGKDPNAVLTPGGWLATAPTPDLMADAQNAAQSAKIALDNIQKATESIADDRFKEDLQGTVHALREILEGVSQKDGVAHRMIFDAEEAKRVDRILGNLEATTANLARVSADARDVSSRVKSGPGLAHTMIYDDQLAQGMTGTVVELHKSLQAVRTGNGLAHAVVYGDDQTQHLMGNVNAMSDDLREIVANMKAGRGTVGALLVDPTVYEDIKSLVGNVERNQVLRALVRYSIKQNEDKPRVEVKSDTPQPTATPTQQKAGN